MNEDPQMPDAGAEHGLAETGTWYLDDSLNGRTTGDLVFGTPERITDPLGRVIEQRWTTPLNTAGGSSLLVRRQYPEGQVVSFAIDNRGNRVETRRFDADGSSSIISSSVFLSECLNPKTCNKPTSSPDANGGVTDYEYSPVHGGIMRVRQPADARGIRFETRYVNAQNMRG